MRFFLILIFLFVLFLDANGQSINIELNDLAMLEPYNEAKNNEIYLESRVHSKSEEVIVYLINQQRDSVEFECSYYINFGIGIEALDIKGNWKLLDRNWGNYCGTESYNKIITNLPPNSYTWEKKSITEINDGIYDTLIRFYTQIGDSTIIQIPLRLKLIILDSIL